MIQVNEEFFPDENKHEIYMEKMEEFKKYYELKIKQY